MKQRSILALLLTAMMLMSMVSFADAETPSTYLSETPVTLRVMRDENPHPPLKADTLKSKTIKELLNGERVIEDTPRA